MDETKNTSALVLNRQPYREKDSLVTVYTKDYGKLRLVARGTKKLGSKLAGHIEPLTLAEMMIIKGRGFDYIGSAITRDAFSGIRADLNRLYYAGKAISLFNRVVRDNEADEGLFFLLKQWLEMIDSFSAGSKNKSEARSDLGKDEGEFLFVFFAFKLLAELGYKPEMHKCLSCGRQIESGKNYFNLTDGGVVCGRCFQDKLQERKEVMTNFLPISDNCVKAVRFICNNQINQAERLKINAKLTKELAILTDSYLKFCF